MTPTPLTPTQVAAINRLVRAGKLERVAPDVPKAERFLAQAVEGIAETANVTATNVRYAVAYDAAHACGEAILAAYGIRTVNGPGQHAALGDTLLVIFPDPPAAAAARHYDRMRMARNDIHYRAKSVGSGPSTAALAAATTLLQATTAQLQ